MSPGKTLVVSCTVVAVLACGGAKSAVEETPAPAVGSRLMTAADSQLSPIAMTAARALRVGSDGKIQFGGIYVGGREMVTLSDAVARAIGAERVGGSGGRVPYAICRIGTPGCTESRANDDVTYTFRYFRIAGTTAFVGSDAPSLARPEGAVCITLLWNGLSWDVKETRSTRNAETCGR